MIRIVIENILLFLLPTAIYLAYRAITRERAGGTGQAATGQAIKQDFNNAPLLWLFVAGAASVLATLIAFGDTSGGKPGQIYHPPEVRDGKIVPGHFE